MSVRREDLLLRAGGVALQRFNSLVVDGRGNPIDFVFSREGVRRVRGQSGRGRIVTANRVAIEYPGLLEGVVDVYGNPRCGPLLGGARTQIVTDPEDFGEWTDISVTPTSGQADPFGGTAAYHLAATSGAGSVIQTTMSYTGNGSKSFLCFLRAGTSTVTRFNVRHVDVADRHLVDVTWTAGVPSLATVAGSGLLRATPWADGWYAIDFTADSVVAGAGNTLQIFPDSSGADGTVYAFGVNAWDAAFPSSYQGPSEATGVADSLTVPFNFGTVEMTGLAIVARPTHADVAGTIAGPPVIYRVGSSAPSFRANLAQSARNFTGFFDTSGTDAQATTAIPAGAELAYCTQVRSIPTGALVKADAGSGFGTEGGPASAAPAYGTQALQIGHQGAGLELYGVLLDLIVARGLFTRGEMLAAAA